MSSDPLSLSATEIATRVRSGEITAERVVKASLDRILTDDPKVRAFLTVAASSAVAAARAIDEKRASGRPLGPLAGVPVGVKDALVTEGHPTTAGSRVLCKHTGDSPPRPEDGYVPPYDATVVRRLRDADAVIVGKCNMDEFAMGSSTEQSGFFATRNPLDLERSPGGSSGGSAAAVAAKMTPAAIGSDTGGSIRQPAAFTGIVGFKPTYGRVSRYGLIAFASSLDQVGAFATDVPSAALVTEVIAGHDPLDSTSIARPLGKLVPDLFFGDTPGPGQGASLRGVRVGVPRAFLETEGLDRGVARKFEETVEKARASGASIVDVTLDHARYAVATYYVIATAEASSNLARFDGVRYGDRAPGKTIDELYRATRARGFGPEVKRRILLGTYVLSAGYYDAYYLRAQKARTLIARDFAAAFEKADVVVTPTTPTVAFKLGEKTRDPLSMYLADVFTLPTSLAGLPAVSIPCGKVTDHPGGTELPVGFQIIGRPLGDADVLRIAAGFEGLTR